MAQHGPGMESIMALPCSCLSNLTQFRHIQTPLLYLLNLLNYFLQHMVDQCSMQRFLSLFCRHSSSRIFFCLMRNKFEINIINIVVLKRSSITQLEGRESSPTPTHFLKLWKALPPSFLRPTHLLTPLKAMSDLIPRTLFSASFTRSLVVRRLVGTRGIILDWEDGFGVVNYAFFSNF